MNLIHVDNRIRMPTFTKISTSIEGMKKHILGTGFYIFLSSGQNQKLKRLELLKKRLDNAKQLLQVAFSLHIRYIYGRMCLCFSKLTLIKDVGSNLYLISPLKTIPFRKY